MSHMQYVSAEGLKKLQEELQHLKKVTRREIANRIEEAKALGDLSENAEYHEAKDALAFVEGRISEIQEILNNVSIVEEGGSSGGVVRVGSTVEVMVDDNKKTFEIVGSNEAEPAVGKISNESPIGSALLGSKVADQVEVTTPKGVTIYKILSIK
ncbi:transcription elongation factor GreA [Candidatus Uhrbacteria bacterium]|nr:transcription elongation factor GreA [Candidatus Uhrbacteria bacterium]